MSPCRVVVAYPADPQRAVVPNLRRHGQPKHIDLVRRGRRRRDAVPVPNHRGRHFTGCLWPRRPEHRDCRHEYGWFELGQLVQQRRRQRQWKRQRERFPKHRFGGTEPGRTAPGRGRCGCVGPRGGRRVRPAIRLSPAPPFATGDGGAIDLCRNGKNTTHDSILCIART